MIDVSKKRGATMQTVRKDIRGLDPKDLEIIAKHAEAEGVSTNDLLREVISDYANRLEEDQASKVLHAYIDDLIMANNNVVHAMNDNTLAIGEMFKVLLARLDMYLPELSDEIDQIQKNSQIQKGVMPGL